MVMLGTDMKIAETPKEGLQDFEIDDAYKQWQKREGVRVINEFAFQDLKAIELTPWERKGGSGAIINIPNDHLNNDSQVVEIKPGGKSTPEHHLYEEMVYVVSGRGATTIWVEEKHKQTFEWHEGSLFSIPLNVWYQHFNGSGSEPVRYLAVTNAPPMMRLFNDLDFTFNDSHVFRGRYDGDQKYFSGNGKLFTHRVWQSNFIPNAPDMALYGWQERGAGGINVMLEMANNNMKSHISEFPVGTYKKAHRHGPGANLVLLSGTSGYSMLWTKDDRSDMVKADWKKGALVIVPSDNCFHQHFNTGANRARYLALYTGGMGLRTPLRVRGEYAQKSVKLGGWQIEYEDEDREIHEIFERDLKANGAPCKMKAFVPWCTGEVGPTSERAT